MTNDRHESRAAGDVRQMLVELVDRHGPGILDDTRRVRAMLADGVRGATAETNLIGLALSSGVPDRLRDSGRDPARVQDAIETTARDLERASSVQAEDARWAVGAVAEALGLRAAASLRPVAVAPPGASGAGPDDLVVQVDGREHVARAGSVVSIGREPGATILVDSPAVSRQHGELRRGSTGWEYRDVGSTQGSFIDGAAVDSVQVHRETVVHLGQGAERVTVRLVPFGTAETRTPHPPLRPVVAATEVPGVPPRPGGALGGALAARTELGGSVDDPLEVTVEGATRTLSPGSVLTVGRGDDNDLVCSPGTVSRHHLRIEHRDGRWQVQDLGSTSGTWLDGRRVTEAALAGDQDWVLGDARSGARMTTRAGQGAAGGAGRRPLTRLRPRLRPSATVGVAVGLAAVMAAGLIAWQVLDDDTPTPVATADPPSMSRDDLARATVYLDVPGGGGSGVIIDREQGLILTNAHVAAPSAVGRGIATLEFKDQQRDDPSQITVHVSTGLDQSAEPRFRAELVAADGYLDVAVLRIDSKLSGAPVEEADLADLTQVMLGDSDQLRTADEISFIGYPQAAVSRAPTFTNGVVSGPVQDDRLDDFRAAINTDATASFGNSGGLAVNADGAMVGVVTWLRPDPLGDPVLSSIRPINLAKPVIEAARAGEDYTSPWATEAPRKARILSGFNYADPGTRGGVADGCEDGPVDLSPLAISVRFRNFAPGDVHTDVLAVLYDDLGRPVSWSVAEFGTDLPRNGCMTLTFNRPVGPGSYPLTIGVGGDLRRLYDGRITLP